MESDNKRAENALIKIRNYKNEPDAFNQKGVKDEWKEQKFLPFSLYKSFVNSVIDEHFNS